MSDHMREQFEDMMSSQGEWPQAIEKDARGGYKFATAATAWETWQSAWEAGQEMMKSRAKELEAINLGLTKTLAEMVAEKAKLVEALKACRDELRWMIERHNHQNQNDGSWLYDYQTVEEAHAALAAYRKQGGEL